MAAANTAQKSWAGLCRRFNLANKLNRDEAFDAMQSSRLTICVVTVSGGRYMKQTSRDRVLALVHPNSIITTSVRTPGPVAAPDLSICETKPAYTRGIARASSLPSASTIAQSPDLATASSG
ncbi:hypothetical protein S7711_11221 [Stachybotrys chartarum IBT 7711]|uniref:Uncharacterized protein n=1 Tax=Stachybotrys chartarum (strain CBS 109288 / IBT 7711) TaxID=1280523 RepID=A0A084AVP8_STACB|nr:hypothetical protein S7711_11221 [Stachybotrys chartarum IBT 7711]KFA45624.1 hypothetical protein S40293_11276 [Stachybotrys chartarum IBT 40293]